MKLSALVFGLLVSGSAFADSYSPEDIYNSLSVQETVSENPVFVGKLTLKSVGGLTCVRNAIRANRVTYACGVDDATTLQNLSIWSPTEVGP